MNPVKGLELLRTFINSKEPENLVENIAPEGFEVNGKDLTTQKLIRCDAPTAFLHEKYG